MPLTEPRPEGVVAAEADDDYDEALFARLRRLRKIVADLEHVPPFVVFHDKSLKEMAKHRPRTGAELLRIYGVSEGKLQRYGRRFLDAIDKHCTEEGPGRGAGGGDAAGVPIPLPTVALDAGWIRPAGPGRRNRWRVTARNKERGASGRGLQPLAAR
ncbi:HRDC domain-containing protein [Methanoculleus sp. 10]|uniref:HRDC domain-containing protein n=1 Tax=Methanoculleus sp. 10 TaxID=430615 RepID=UPI0025F8341E|nr:HRDC domain-containing protein [Methanoculleus sp. 10]